jgi:hypothetical protein
VAANPLASLHAALRSLFAAIPGCECGRLPARKTIFAMHKRTSAKSGVRPPAVDVSMVIATEYVFVESGVRPPAVGIGIRLRRHKRDCSGNCRRRMCRSPLHWRFWLPRGANAPRSCLASADACRCEKQFLRCTNAHQQRAAGVSPPWFNKRAYNTDTAHVRGYSSCAKTGAAGVSPPWV